MNYVYIYIHIHLFIFLISLSHNNSCFGAKIDKQYQACAPKYCGNQSISFPFFINGLQEPYCGSPGFNVTCQNNNTLLQITEDDDQYLLVHQIFYQNHTLRVSNAALASGGGGSCNIIQYTRNLTIRGDKFVRLNNSNLVLLWNCSELDYRLKRYRVGCDNYNMLAMNGNSSGLLSSGMEACKVSVVTPIQDDNINNGSSEYYLEVMRKGFVLKWTATNCTECQLTGGRCGFNIQNYQFICFCTDRPHYRSCSSTSTSTSTADNKTKVIIATAILGTAAIILICLVIIIGRHRRWGIIFTSFLSRKTDSDIEDSISYFGVPVFSYKDLEDATNKFDPSKELGDGGYGTVYHGKLRDGREVAVKRLYENNFKRVEQFMNEIKILTGLRHRNLVLLYGSTSHRSNELLLVYEYIPNGTVADHLHGDRAENEPLSWPVRMQIALETASALSYLHKSEIIHRDVKTNNILLDANFTVKVADFGLSRLFPVDATHVSTAPQGTPGYVDPEYHQCYQLSDKSDVYSFGVVLIELISSMPAVDISRSRNEINLANLAINRIQKCAFDELIDPTLGYKSDPTIERMTTSVAELAFRCLQLEKELRPTMDEVFECLVQIQAVGQSKRVPTPSPESDNAVLLKNKRFPTSPVTVIVDNWTSSRSTTPSTSSNF